MEDYTSFIKNEEGLHEHMRSYSQDVFLIAKSKVQMNIYICYLLCKKLRIKNIYTHIYRPTHLCQKKNGKDKLEIHEIGSCEDAGELDERMREREGAGVYQGRELR